MVELISNSFIAGFTVVFGIVALGIVEAYIPPRFGNLGAIGGALAFGVALIFLIVGRTELFNENFFDPLAAAVDDSDSWLVASLLRLWTVTFALNLVGGGLFALVFTIQGVLPPGAQEVLRHTGVEIIHRRTLAGFGKAIVGGALVAMLSFLLEAVDSVGSRITLAYIVGVLLTLGPFDHVIVTVLHVFFAMLYGGDITLTTLAVTTAAVTAGNLVGGVGLVTFSHIAQLEEA